MKLFLSRLKKIQLAQAATTALALILVIIVAVAFVHLNRAQEAASTASVEAAVRKGVMACYASEGVYPPDMAYLENNYGIHVDEDRYTVRYVIFAENIMPDITVIKK